MADLGEYANPKNRTDAEIRSIERDPASRHRERGFRPINYFLRGKTLIKDNMKVVALEAGREETRPIASIFEWIGNKNHDYNFLVAMGGYIRWANTSGRCTETAWKGWDENAQCAGRRPYSEYGNDRRDTLTEEMHTTTSRRRCSALAKTQLSNLAVGVGMLPEDSTDGKEVGSGR